jgi:hypothetical protein
VAHRLKSCATDITMCQIAYIMNFLAADIGNQNIPDIITAAAKSALGIFALMIIVLSFLAWRFFQNAPEQTRVFIFLCLFAGVAFFGVAVVNQANEKPDSKNKESLTDALPSPVSIAQPSRAPAPPTVEASTSSPSAVVTPRAPTGIGISPE